MPPETTDSISLKVEESESGYLRPDYFFSFSFIALLTDFRPTLTLATAREYLSQATVSIVTVSPAISSFKALVADAPPRCPFSGAFTLASRTGCLRLAVSNVSPSITLVTRSFLAIVLIFTIQVHNHAQVKPLLQHPPPTQLSAVAVAQKARPTSQRCPISTRSSASSASIMALPDTHYHYGQMLSYRCLCCDCSLYRLHTNY